MNRFHVHLNVADLAASIRFYSELFAAQPAVLKPDYAKWMLEDPRVNFAISTTGRTPGIDHLGFQVESDEALAAIGQRLDAAGGTVVPEEATICCYAQSDKLWTEDPQGTRWETFHTKGEATTYHARCRLRDRWRRVQPGRGLDEATPGTGEVLLRPAIRLLLSHGPAPRYSQRPDCDPQPAAGQPIAGRRPRYGRSRLHCGR